MGNLKVNDAWEKLFEKYNVIEEVKEKGYIMLTSNQIKEFKEPRLMAKWDSSESLPDILKKNKINILSNSRSSYILGDFKLYKEIPPLKEHVTKMDKVDLPYYESIDINNITSESNAINVLVLSKILDDFLDVSDNDETVSTFNGRMGTGVFEFDIDTYRQCKQHICVKNAQCEIDGGFENNDSVIIMEAKNVVNPDFNIRQLYYPYRLWKTKVKKPIRLIFSVYSNQIFRLFEYGFNDINNFSSIYLIKQKNYSLQDTSINFEEICNIRKETEIIYNDIYEKKGIPFIQANSFERIISLLENMYKNPLTKLEIAELMQFDERQADYYFNAGRYLRIFEYDDDGTSRRLTKQGENIIKMKYKDRIMTLISLIFQHKIFAQLFDYIIDNGEVPSKKYIQNKMRELSVCGESLIVRRSSSVEAWLNWILNLLKL